MPGVWETLRPELLLVKQRMNKELQLKTGPVSNFLELDLDTTPLLVLPALVILSARAYGYTHPRVTCMAGVVQMMFLAASIHNEVPDDGERLNGDPLVADRERSQFSVLIGDYIYGKVLRLLCEADCVEMLPWLAGVICEMNEAAMVRLQAEKTGRINLEIQLEILRREFAVLFGAACRIGAILAGAADEQILNLIRVGENLGMVLGIRERQLDGQLLAQYIEEARRGITQVTSDWGREMLEAGLKILASPRGQMVQTLAG
ncbi:MAG: hypothetical protein HPY81_02555 [Firmicutes bacterium]|nr:hypothetical protein [Bacillota bacterium]